ncbi:MAG: hypothetical protein IVW57_00295 [Ktedonobacterales bacterium]|nr:hypothetical protein [Ktedonobacterales bacterium]
MTTSISPSSTQLARPARPRRAIPRDLLTGAPLDPRHAQIVAAPEWYASRTAPVTTRRLRVTRPTPAQMQRAAAKADQAQRELAALDAAIAADVPVESTEHGKA